MKNNYKTYLLIIIVIIIWGLIAYKIYSRLNPEDVKDLSINQEILFDPIQEQKVDTFSLQVNYRDPFLGKPYKASVNKPIKRTTIVAKKEEIVFPEIQYNGLIAPKSKDRQPVFMLLVQNKQYLFSKGDVNDGIKLLKGNANQVEIVYKDAKRIYSKID